MKAAGKWGGDRRRELVSRRLPEHYILGVASDERARLEVAPQDLHQFEPSRSRKASRLHEGECWHRMVYCRDCA